MDRYLRFIKDYLEREYTLPEDIDIERLNYVDTGYVDSLGLIQFYAVLEDHFDITFTDEELKDPDIRIVGGLIGIIKRKLHDED